MSALSPALEHMNPVFLGFVGSLAAGLVTSLGALPVLFGKDISPRVSDAMLGFAAGVMLAASFFSLIIPGLDIAKSIFTHQWIAAIVVTAGVLLGAAFVGLLNEVVPHEHFMQGREGPGVAEVGRVWLFVLAIAIHNLPEGLAVGVGFADGNIASGAILATGIGLQNARKHNVEQHHSGQTNHEAYRSRSLGPMAMGFRDNLVADHVNHGSRRKAHRPWL
jgi:ZIP family zinc transporter